MTTPLFDHEKLRVYQETVDFLRDLQPLLDRIPKGLSAHDQLDRASTSIPLNIAEGNGKYTSRDRCRFFDTARGSALECGACLDVVVAKGLLEPVEVAASKEKLTGIVSMLVGLIRSNSPDRVHEAPADYETNA
jgi:four helix bundle protein